MRFRIFMSQSPSSPASFSSCNHIPIRSTAGILGQSANQDHRRRAPFVDVEFKRMRRGTPPQQQHDRKNEQTAQREGWLGEIKSSAAFGRRRFCLHIQKMAPAAALLSPLPPQPRGLFVRSCHRLAYDARQPTCVAFSQGEEAPMAARDGEVRPKLGRIRDRKGRKTISYINRVLRTA